MARRDALVRGETSCEEAVDAELANAGRYNERLNAFITLFEGRKGTALSRARELDIRQRSSKRGVSALFGVPLAIKDNIFLGGFPTTAATYHYRDFVPNQNARIVDDALRLGAIPLGKTNLHELALGGTSAASYFGPVRNPRDPSRVSGGSSGGSAVAVAAAKGPVLGLGTDTGGSIRVPAAFCGVVGFKPTLGTLSLEGVFPLSATLDHAGLLTRTVSDMVTAFEELAGIEVRGVSKGKKVRVGVLTGYLLEETEKSVLKNLWRALDAMKASGEFSIVEVPTDPSFERFTRARGAIQLSEASWFYGELVTSKETAAKMNPDVVTLLRRGMKMGKARYMGAELVRLESIRIFGRLLKGLDVLATPTTRVVAPKVEDVLGNEAGNLRRLLLQNLELFNLSGFPALSVPSHGRGDELPTGIQFAGRLGEDGQVLRAGELAARATAHA